MAAEGEGKDDALKEKAGRLETESLHNKYFYFYFYIYLAIACEIIFTKVTEHDYNYREKEEYTIENILQKNGQAREKKTD
jgi:hypothetical protein